LLPIDDTFHVPILGKYSLTNFSISCGLPVTCAVPQIEAICRVRPQGLSLEERAVRVKGILGQMGRRLNHVESELTELRKAIDRSFRWTIGVMLIVLMPMWVTTMLAIVLK